MTRALLAWVWCEDGRMLNEDLIAAGHVTLICIEPEDKHYERLD